jgi:GNAT superfamily N-acetyltransferase
MTFTIRLADAADTPALTALKLQMNRAEYDQYPTQSPVRALLDLSHEAAAAGVAHYWRMIETDGGEFWVAEQAGAVIGSALWAPFAASAAFSAEAQAMALIAAVVVAESARGQGVGAALMAHIETRIRAAGITVALLEVTHGNVAAQALYAKSGFAPLEVAMIKRLV